MMPSVIRTVLLLLRAAAIFKRRGSTSPKLAMMITPDPRIPPAQPYPSLSDALPCSRLDTKQMCDPSLLAFGSDDASSSRDAVLAWSRTLSRTPGCSSFLKKNTTFVKKLRSVTSETMDAIVHEFYECKMERFLEESAAAILQSRMRSHDEIFCAVKVVHLFHACYPDFAHYFHKLLAAQAKEIATASSQLVCSHLCFLFELFLTDAFADFGLLFSALQVLKSPSDDSAKTWKHGAVFVLMVKTYSSCWRPSGLPALAPPLSSPFTSQQQSQLCDFFAGIFSKQCSALTKMNARLLAQLAIERKYYETRGDISDERVSSITNLSDRIASLSDMLHSISDLVGIHVPELEKNSSIELQHMRITFKDPSFIADGKVYASEEERSFYEKFDIVQFNSDVASKTESLFVEDVEKRETGFDEGALLEKSKSSKEAVLFERLSSIDSAAEVERAAAFFLANSAFSDSVFISVCQLEYFLGLLSACQAAARADQVCVQTFSCREQQPHRSLRRSRPKCTRAL